MRARLRQADSARDAGGAAPSSRRRNAASRSRLGSLYDKADVGHWFRASGGALEYTRSSLRADGTPTLREDDVATPLCAASKATVDFLEDLDMRRFAEVAKACVLDAATCAAGGFARETRDAWRAIADATRAPFLDCMNGALTADADAAAAASASFKLR